MASTLSGAVSALVALLQGIDGSGDNLDVGGRVTVGPVTQSAAALALFVHSFSAPRTLETSLGRYRQYLRCTIEGVVGAGYATPILRVQAAMDLMDDVITVIDANRTLTSTVLDARVLDADIVEADGQIRGCRVLMEAWFHPTAGA